MRKEDREMMEKIMDTERVGYAYFYPRESEGCEVYYISTTPENLANFIGSHFHDANRMTITDIVDRLILTTFGGFIADCPDQNLCLEIIPHLAPIQMGEKEAGEVLAIERTIANEYFVEEERMATQAEYQSM